MVVNGMKKQATAKPWINCGHAEAPKSIPGSKVPGAPVEADRVHNKAEGDQPPHVELMREAADNRATE